MELFHVIALITKDPTNVSTITMFFSLRKTIP